ncbi:hypothetical protein SFC57_24140 [Niallia circulans]|uniref:hypothetical protein n=1 Tax=Bacillaceae TaxID=186817 RepID=UPI0039794B0F
MINLLRVETIGDYDCYFFTEITDLSKRNIMIIVDFGTNKIRGDEVSYGKYTDLTFEECVRFLRKLKNTEIKRCFNHLI